LRLEVSFPTFTPSSSPRSLPPSKYDESYDAMALTREALQRYKQDFLKSAHSNKVSFHDTPFLQQFTLLFLSACIM